MSYDRSTDSRPQVGRSSADSLHAARQGNAVGRRSADHRATVGRMENFVVVEGNQWGMFLMWQLQSADQNRVCRPINIKNQVGRLSVLVWLRHYSHVYTSKPVPQNEISIFKVVLTENKIIRIEPYSR